MRLQKGLSWQIFTRAEGFSGPSDKSSLDGADYLKATLVTIEVHTVGLIALYANIMFTMEIS